MLRIENDALVIETARVFQPALAPYRYKGLMGGRGSGKSHFAAEYILWKAAMEPGLRVVCVREVQKSLKESAKMLIEDKMKLLGPNSGFESRTDETRTPGDGVIIYRGMQDYNAMSIKSLEGFKLCWGEEARTLSQTSLELLRPTLRAEGSEFLFTWNPDHPSDAVDVFFRKGKPPPDSLLIKANLDDNPFRTKALELEREFDRVHNPDRFAHVWEGEYAPQVVGAIWDQAIFNEWRREPPAETPFHQVGGTTLQRILVSVDHAVSSGEGANEHGIIVGGRGDDNRGYVVEDATTVGPPKKWASRTVEMYDKWGADGVVIEENQGGDLVENVLRSERSDLPIIRVRATRGKHVRAEPISAVYKGGRVSHVGPFPELESQMCQMTAAGWEGSADHSPDRCDALVWLFTELFPSMMLKSPSLETSWTWDDVYREAAL